MNRHLNIKKISLFVIMLISIFAFENKVKADNKYCYYKGVQLKNNILIRVTKNTGKVEFFDINTKNTVSTATGRNDEKTYSNEAYSKIIDADLKVTGDCPNNIHVVYYVIPNNYIEPDEATPDVYEPRCSEADKSYTCYAVYAFGGRQPARFKQDKNGHDADSEMPSKVDYPNETRSKQEIWADEVMDTLFAVKKSRKQEKQTGVAFKCENMPKTFGYVKGIYNFMRFIVPALIVVFSTIDFASVVITGEDDKMVKAKKNFIIRLIVGIAILFIPIILESLLKLAGILESGDNLIDLACLK